MIKYPEHILLCKSIKWLTIRTTHHGRLTILLSKSGNRKQNSSKYCDVFNKPGLDETSFCQRQMVSQQWRHLASAVVSIIYQQRLIWQHWWHEMHTLKYLSSCHMDRMIQRHIVFSMTFLLSLPLSQHTHTSTYSSFNKCNILKLKSKFINNFLYLTTLTLSSYNFQFAPVSTHNPPLVHQ